MNEIIKISYENDTPVVSARELHEFLEVGTDFRHWFPRMCEYGFSEIENYTPVIFDHPLNGQPTTDYAITVDMAKELCMLQRNDRGKQARTYFVQLEKAWNSPEAVMARAIKMAEKQINTLQLQIEDQRPLVEFANTVAKSCDNILMRDMAKLLCDEHVIIGEKRLYKLLRKHDVLMSSNDPYQSFVDRGYFVVKETPYNTPYGEELNRTTLVTPKGQIWLVGKVKGWID